MSCFYYSGNTQCSPQVGAPPHGPGFTTGGAIVAGEPDPKWKVAKDSIDGIYEPAVRMSQLPQIYYNGPDWISFSASGEHSGARYFFYKIEFILPCYNLCGKSYDEENTFCLNLDLYADNSIYEIFVNGIAQSGSLGNIMPLPDPFNPVGHSQSDKITVNLCKGWKAGNNSLVIQVASSATVAGMMAAAAVDSHPPPGTDTIQAAICDGEKFHFGDSNITVPGFYFHSFPRPGGCDSNVVLKLTVNPVTVVETDKVICEGELYSGYSQSGTYIEKYKAANGCDSIRKLHLAVNPKPQPAFNSNMAVCGGDSLAISPGQFSSYLWQDGSANDHFIVKKPGRYVVSVSNGCGSASAEALVHDGVCQVFFPGAFTPNKDGKNDFFKVLSDLGFQEYRLLVYNRWGQKVFQTTDPAAGWNGGFMGVEQDAGVYTWHCNFNKSGKAKSLHGTVMLLR